MARAKVKTYESNLASVGSAAGQNRGTAALRATVAVAGAIYLLGLYPLTVLWPSGWAWHASGVSTYLQMILGVYATLGVFLLMAAGNPLRHLSLIWFTVWSNVVHAGIMTVQSLVYPQHRGHLLGDVPALLLVAAALAIVTPRSAKQ